MNIDYLLLYLEFYKDILKKSKTGAAIPHLNKELFKKLLITIPPIKEQKKIVQIVKEYFKNLNKIEQNLR